jgi:pyrroline-5-carboxylate reductase
LTARAGFLGAGHIARPLAEGWRQPLSDPAARPALAAYDPLPGRAAALGADFDATSCSTVAELVAHSDVVVLAMRPTDVAGALAALAPLLGRRPLVSLAAAVPLDDLLGGLAAGARVARVMPNVAAAIGRGVFLFLPGTLSGPQAGEVRALFELSGTVVEVSEDLFDPATAVAGCGPGFTALFIEALAAAGVKAGLSETMARELAIAGVAGSAELVAREGDPVGVREAIATPGGMTSEGIDVLETRGLREALAAAVAAAVDRARGKR